MPHLNVTRRHLYRINAVPLHILLNKVFYLMLDFDVFMQHAAEFVVVSIPLKSFVSALLKESLPVLCGAELLGSAR